jgi:predicted alpha/beta hydrolase family esterase
MSVRDGSRQGVTKTQVLFVHGGGGEAFEGDVPIFLYHSRDDEVVPFAHLAMYSGRLPHATVREVKDRGHQLGDDLSEVAEDIAGL